MERDCGCALFELLQDGVLPPLKCPLCPEGVSLSAAQSDRQSGALKAHTPFSIQRLGSKTPGLGAYTHRIRVFRVKGHEWPTFLNHYYHKKWIYICSPSSSVRKSLARKISVYLALSNTAATDGQPMWTLFGLFETSKSFTFKPPPTPLSSPFVSRLISGLECAH